MPSPRVPDACRMLALIAGLTLAQPTETRAQAAISMLSDSMTTLYGGKNLPFTWRRAWPCLSAIPESATRRATVFLTATTNDTLNRLQMSQANEIARAVAAQIRTSLGGPAGSVPDGMARMTWRSLPAVLTVTAISNGRISRAVRGPPTDTSASSFLIKTYDDVRRAGGAKMPWLAGRPGDSVVVSLWLDDSNVDSSGDIRDPDPGEARFTAFSLMQPVLRSLGRSSAAKLRYPNENRRERVDGMIRMRFVVDTNGRVDPSSIHEVQEVDSQHDLDQSTEHQLFAQAVREWIPQNEYVHYSVGGCQAAIVQEQPVKFVAP